MIRHDFSTAERMVLVAILSALACLLLSLVAGALGALYYLPGLSNRMAAGGISLVEARPLHTTFASAWIFLGCVACIYHFLFRETGDPSTGDVRRFKAHMVLFGAAGLGALLTLAVGVTTGREYVGIHPSLSLLIVVGWVLFAWSFFRRIARGFWARPVYVYMWSTGILFFLYTFLEGHAWLLPGVRDQPIADLQIQWKSCGTLVASFNQMVYGCLAYIGESYSRDRRVGQSRTAFALFGVGLLNSFTNYAHHTYHLPQSDVIKWTAFVVSMLEIILLYRLFREVLAAMQRRGQALQRFHFTTRIFALSKRWNVFLLSLAILISVPPLNSLIHGTHVVMAHAMASELAIDSYVLLGAFAWILTSVFPKREVLEDVLDSGSVRATLRLLNVSLIGLVICLMGSGLSVAVTRCYGRPAPAWMDGFPPLFAFLGCSVVVFLVRLVNHWLPLLRQPRRHKRFAWEDQRIR